MNVYRLLGDVVLVVHTAFILFVILGLLLTAVGALAGWSWVRNFWFRIIHLGAIGFVLLQTYLGQACPLTVLEHGLRLRAGQEWYGEGGFIQYWLHQIVFFDAPTWLFMVVYTVFALLVVVTFIFVPPRPRRWYGRDPSRERVETEAGV
jgi:hypothetical protein